MPQFITTFCLLSAVIVISQLIRLSDVLATFGISLENILLPFLFILLPFFTFLIPMAFIFSVFLGFSRLSSDGELTAMLASGFSLRQAFIPVFMMGVVLYGLGAYSASYFEAWGRREYMAFSHRKAQTAIDNMLRVNLRSGVFLDNFLGYVLYSESISPDGTYMENVLLAPGRGQEKQNFILFAPSATIVGSVETGDLKMSFDYGMIHSSRPNSEESSVVKFKSMEIDLLRIFQDQIFGSDSFVDDYRSYPPQKLRDFLATVRNSETDENRQVYYKANFLFHQRFGMPFATIVFAFFGLIFGIQDERRGKSYGYVMTIVVIMIGYVIFMTFKWLAEKGLIDGIIGAWFPNVILGFFGGLLLWQKDRLALSESPLDPRYWKSNRA